FFSSRKRHTKSSRDWSSDVCSSDLLNEQLERNRMHSIFSIREYHLARRGGSVQGEGDEQMATEATAERSHGKLRRELRFWEAIEIGRASCRERVQVTRVDGERRERR